MKSLKVINKMQMKIDVITQIAKGVFSELI